MPTLDEITAFLHAEMPLSKAMGVRLTAWDGRTAALAAPLALNDNHADTAFGGSIATLGILANYALLYLLLQERNISTRIIIQKSSTDFRFPIDADLVATSSAPPPDILEEFLTSLTRKRRGRIELAAQILSQSTPAATHTGLFVAILY